MRWSVAVIIGLLALSACSDADEDTAAEVVGEVATTVAAPSTSSSTTESTIAEGQDAEVAEPAGDPATDIPIPTTDEAPFEDVAELIDLEIAGLTNVVITEVEPAGGNWIVARGTGETEEDTIIRLETAEIAEACAVTTDQVRAVDSAPVYRLGPVAATVGTVEFELVPEPAIDRVDRESFDPEGVSTNGWYSGSWGTGNVDGIEGFVIDGLNEFDRESITRVEDDWIEVGTPEFDALCAEAATN